MMNEYYGADDINEEFDMAAHDEIAIVPVSKEQLDAFAQVFGFEHFEDLAKAKSEPNRHPLVRAPEIVAAAEAAGIDPSEYGTPSPEEIRRMRLEQIDSLQAQLDELRSYLMSDQQ